MLTQKRFARRDLLAPIFARTVAYGAFDREFDFQAWCRDSKVIGSALVPEVCHPGQCCWKTAPRQAEWMPRIDIDATRDPLLGSRGAPCW